MVPDAWTPGTLLMVGAPDGRTMKVGVPAGLRPGDYFVVVFPPPAGSGVSAGAGAKPVAGSAGPSEPDEDTELAEAMRMSLAEEREKAELERQLVRVAHLSWALVGTACSDPEPWPTQPFISWLSHNTMFQEEAKEASRRELAVEQERRQLAAEAEARRLSEEARRREAVRQQELERARVMWQQQQREAQQVRSLL